MTPIGELSIVLPGHPRQDREYTRFVPVGCETETVLEGCREVNGHTFPLSITRRVKRLEIPTLVRLGLGLEDKGRLAAYSQELLLPSGLRNFIHRIY